MQSSINVHYYDYKDRDSLLYNTERMPAPHHGLVVSFDDDKYQVVEVEWMFLGSQKQLFVDAYVMKLGNRRRKNVHK